MTGDMQFVALGINHFKGKILRAPTIPLKIQQSSDSAENEHVNYRNPGSLFVQLCFLRLQATRLQETHASVEGKQNIPTETGREGADDHPSPRCVCSQSRHTEATEGR